jgi:hypothetical protein
MAFSPLVRRPLAGAVVMNENSVRCCPLSAFVTDASLEGKSSTRKRRPRRAKNGVIAAENARRPTRSDARRYPIDIGDYHSDGGKRMRG